MLVLGRKIDESVVIEVPPDPDGRPRRIAVHYLSHRGREGVRLGFDADADITIHRGEIQSEIDARRAAGREAR